MIMASKQPSEEEVQESIRRVRRGCLGSALIFMALSLLLINSTGNLAFSLLLVVSLVLVILSRMVR
jgi:hypothetical protein